MSENKKEAFSTPFKYKMDNFFSVQLFAGNQTYMLEPLRISVFSNTMGPFFIWKELLL